ncbi:503b68a0-d4b3-47b5-921a-9af09f522d6a-CDS [Sclerotinia trifoliorum]|uniref:503b68a0-d4b3-47b5-921a-9af09f522d6a-CDS n=1 Tax=Sclerotinia trifoliorum TaxID=28548 RepID=A0A8H2VWJ3_9HELO|nr:503b68a0-d4b3-47b5-921a-9af09f522d6a-CDS [Sclerotinia trifoliorum]
MEPVPELHSLEEFRASPVPRLRLQESALYDSQTPIKDREQSARPQTLRRTTEPIPQSPRSPGWSSPVTPTIPLRPRNTSPYARGHFRSRSNGSVLAPPMSRAQSLPAVNGAGHLLMSPQRPASPLGSPARVRIPRKPADEVFPGFPNRALINISEGEQPAFDEDTSKMSDRSASPILGIPSSGSYTRVRRPASPLRHITTGPFIGGATPTTPSSSTSSPSYNTTKFGESYLTSNISTSSLYYPGSYTSSSVPSTPTSTRSRSPSISSLETIPDTPDAEEAAIEADRIAQLKAAADAADGAECEDAKSRGVDTSGGRGRGLGGFGSRDKRKRWSVCGAERRGDLNLDTIWED